MHHGEFRQSANGIEATGLFVEAIDIELPDIPGLDLLGRFCQLEQENGTPPVNKIMVTAHSKVDCVIKAREQCDAFLVKPIRKDALLAKIAELLPALYATGFFFGGCLEWNAWSRRPLLSLLCSRLPFALQYAAHSSMCP